MQKYNEYIGKEYWLAGSLLQFCEGPTKQHCSEFLKLGSHLRVDGLVPNHVESVGTSVDAPYFHVALDDGRSGFADAAVFRIMATTINPVLADAECKKKGDLKLGMSAKQVAATCWGPPTTVDTKMRATGKYEKYIYSDNRFVYLRDGIVTSVLVKGRYRDDLPSLR